MIINVNSNFDDIENQIINSKGKDIELLFDNTYLNNGSNFYNLAKFIERIRNYNNVKITCEFDEQKMINTSQCKALEKIDNYLRENSNSQLFVHDTKEMSTFGFRDTVEANRKLDTVANKIKNATTNINGENEPLSTYEKFMMAYEYVTDFIYSKESKDESNDLSRKWVPILTGDKIVCAGYASLLKELCNRIFDKKDLEVFTQGIRAESEGNGANIANHQNNYVYIKDDKYGIDGMFYADACWDSKQTKEDKIKAQAFCCIPITDVPNIKKGKKAYFDKSPIFPTLINLLLWDIDGIDEEKKIKIEGYFLNPKEENDYSKFLKNHINDLDFDCYKEVNKERVEEYYYSKKKEEVEEFLKKCSDIEIAENSKAERDFMMMSMMHGNNIDEYLVNAKTLVEELEKNKDGLMKETKKAKAKGIECQKISEKIKDNAFYLLESYSREQAEKYIEQKEYKKMQNIDKVRGFINKTFSSTPINFKTVFNAYLIIGEKMGMNKEEAEKYAYSRINASKNKTEHAFHIEKCSNAFAEISRKMNQMKKNM